MPVREEDVIAAYRLILGRYPESKDVVKRHSSASNVHQLRDAFLDSEEFRQKYANRRKADIQDLTLYLPVTVPPLSIDVACPAPERRLLLERVASTWKKLGQERPHWSVLTDSKFLPDSIDHNVDEFHRSGADDLKIIRAILARCVPQFELRVADITEYGCGIGRVTTHLARACKAVFACDVSQSHLDLASEHIHRENLANVSFHLVTEDELNPAPECDLWFSRLVLQHNPPPVIAAILERAFAKIRRGGVAIFQVPTYWTGYSFRLSNYLKAPPSPEMEMHVIPQQDVFRIAALCGFLPTEVREDNSVGAPHMAVSSVFCFVKQRK